MQGLVSYKTEHFFFSSSFSIDRLIDSSTRNQNPTPGVFDCNREMVKGQLQYEEIRKQRLEENKKKLEDLNLTHLLHTVRNASPKSSPVKQGKPRAIRGSETNVGVRRSSRVANLPAPDYKGSNVEYGERTWIRGRLAVQCYKRRSLLQRVYASDEARADAIKKATKVQSDLDPEFPGFVKPMLQSHVTGGFWLGLPKQFCDLNLPKFDATMTLIDESGGEHQTRYLARKAGLSAGWKGFSIAHELVDGDALVFQLINATEFKVYIIRASGSLE
eukprot:TRINITY_DN37439_c0_g3_i1.p1 TRINITY_DN37439_c0_g3~~TRINITY_DN37439_c0_g3_i1.p1  ORF type:complete len:274 (+),score=58.63 TRINITY_DN37439_c0_g3_i1:219-1040(+)